MPADPSACLPAADDDFVTVIETAAPVGDDDDDDDDDIGDQNHDEEMRGFFVCWLAVFIVNVDDILRGEIKKSYAY